MDRIDALRLFVRLAEHHSFSAAARDLKIKQSTASKWIAALEAELGTSLVRRTTRSVQLTDAGRRLLARGHDLLALFDQMTGELDDRHQPSGRIRISVSVAFGRLFVVPAIAEFLQRHPQVHAELVFGDQYVNLVDGGFDLAIRVGVPADTSARGRKLADSRRVLVAAPSYLAAHGRPTTPRDLRRHECLVHGDASAPMVWRFRRSSDPDAPLDAMAAGVSPARSAARGPALHGRTPPSDPAGKGSRAAGSAARGAPLHDRTSPIAVRGRITASNSEAVLLLANRGLGIALLADWLVAADLRRGRLIPLLEDFAAPAAPIVALTPPGRFASPTVSAVIDHLARALAIRLRKPGESTTGSARDPGPAPADGRAVR